MTTLGKADLPVSLQAIAPLDTMRDLGDEGEAAYFNVGFSALRLCQKALDGTLPKRVLDFPVGYGRVARWFRYAWPDARLFGVETDLSALDFSIKTFDMEAVGSDPKLDNIALPKDIDLIFSGSLLTHFHEYQWDNYLKACAAALSATGVLVFTVHGRVSALLAKNRHPIYGNTLDTNVLYKIYKEKGFSYAPYSDEYPDFGLSYSSPSWIMKKLEAIPDLKIIGFEEQGWGQDVVTLRKNPWPMVRSD